MRKRGSLSLSVNAIVILVLALTMLGLGISFMRGMFMQLDDTVKQVTPDQLTNPPTRDNPVTLSPTQLNLRSNDKMTKTTLAFMNTLDQEYDFQLETTGDWDSSWMKANLDTVKMGRDQINSWNILVSPKNGASAGLYLVRFKIKQQTGGDYEATKDLAIDITT